MMSIPVALHVIAYTAAALWFLTWLGNWICRIILEKTGLAAALDSYRQKQDAPVTTKEDPAPKPAIDLSPAVGRVIGLLERLLIAAGVILGSWEILAAVIALKTVARFKEIDDRIPAEYFLVGSLFSIGWAVAVTTLWMLYDTCLGANLVAIVRLG